MASPKKLGEMAKRWIKVAGHGVGKRSFTSFQGNNGAIPPTRGHFAAYTQDGARFEVPLKLLANDVFVELLKKAEEKFGLESGGPIVLPCDSSFLENVLLKKTSRNSKATELLFSMRSSDRTCSVPFQTNLSDWENELVY